MKLISVWLSAGELLVNVAYLVKNSKLFYAKSALLQKVSEEFNSSNFSVGVGYFYKFFAEAPKKKTAVRDVTLCKYLPASTFR
jgi:hypothetical protein